MRKKSVSNAKWVKQDISKKDLLFIQQKYGVCEIVAAALCKRVDNLDCLQDFLSPKLKNLLPDPFLLLDMKAATQRIKAAIQSGEKIVIYGDYDVDGATSSALFKNYFAQIGVQVDIYIPDRILEGYGPNKQAFLNLAQSGYTLCITVDCGIVAHAEIEFAQQNGLDVIVVDHHISTDKMPSAVAVVNPNRIDQSQILHTESLAAVGVSFLVLIALNVVLRYSGFFQENAIKEPNLIQFLDVVALGTVCDIVKLTGINRAFVFQGLKVIKKNKNLGLATLIAELGIFDEISAYHLGYIIGPHINAGGRISKSSLGSQLLCTKCSQEAKKIAHQLIALNIKRKEIEDQALGQALLQVESVEDKFVMVSSDQWHQGIIGIVASRLKDHFYLPTFVISCGQSVAKASARSIKGTNLGAVVIIAKSEKIIIEGGGHKMAAGFSVENAKLLELRQFFKKQFANINTERIIEFDAQIKLWEITQTLCSQLEVLEPHGVGNPEPKFVISDFSIAYSRVIKDQHVSCVLVDNATGAKKNAIAFRAMQSGLGKILIDGVAKKILAKIKLNHWNGRQDVQIIIDDVSV
jgi:single-stranded-DNA-specific exonuclease